VDNEAEITKLALLVKEQFPHIKIIARAHNRMHASELAIKGIDTFVREVFDSGLTACGEVLQAYGYSAGQSENMLDIFERHDQKMLNRVIEENMEFESIVQSAQQGREELEQLFKDDRKSTE
jgi:CPA2 family monovalent cation:H+ antiporter-2